MQIEIQLTSSPIPEQLPREGGDGVGAWVEFRGVVRRQENGRSIAALEYESYSPMAEREMKRIVLTIANGGGCVAVKVIHRVGVVPVGQAAIYIGVASRHRAEAFSLLAEFMDRLKQDVPIWKARALYTAAAAPPSTLAAPEMVLHHTP